MKTWTGARFAHDQSLPCAICDGPATLGMRTTGAALPPPLQNGRGSTDWYHGTSFDPAESDPDHDEDENPGGRVEGPHRDNSEYGGNAQHHWNTDFGAHFTSLKGVAKMFATGGTHTPNVQPESRILHAGLHMANPRHYETERDMGKEAVEWAHANGHHFLGHTGDSARDEHQRKTFLAGRYDHMDCEHGEDGDDDCYEDSKWSHLHHQGRFGQVARNQTASISAKGVQEHHSVGDVDNYLRMHPHREEITSGFEAHLKSQGHDGITYGNSYEGPIGHKCAIAFHDTPVHHRRWEWLHPDKAHLNDPQDNDKHEVPFEQSALPGLKHHEFTGSLISVEAFFTQARTEPWWDTHIHGPKAPWMIRTQQEHSAHLEAHKADAERATNGNMVSPEGKAAGIRPEHFFQPGSRRTVEKWGTPEMKTWVGSDSAPRVGESSILGKMDSLTEYRRQVQKSERAAYEQHGGAFDDSHIDYAKFATFVRHEPSEGHTLCKRCSGRGEIGSGFDMSSTPYKAIIKTCPKCEGTKEVPHARWTPPNLTPEQVEASTPREGENHSQSSARHLDFAKNPTPGTHVWRGEVRHKDHLSDPPSVGMHWTTEPAMAIISRDVPEHHVPVLWEARIDHPEHQTIPRSHPVWQGKHRSLDPEMEVRLQPGASVHVTRAYHSNVDGGEHPGGAPWPSHPQHTSGDWSMREVGKDVPVEHKRRAREHNSIDYSDVGIHTTGTVLDSWAPTERLFAPTKGGVDPRLFDPETRVMKPKVRASVLVWVNQFFERHGYNGAGGWKRVYLAGSQASEWYGNNDFDILVGVDYDAFRRMHPDLVGLSDEEIGARINNEFRSDFNDEQWHPPFDPEVEWHLTGYVNKDSWDIRKIKPYAAYNVTDNTWAVDPIHEPTGHHFEASEMYYFEGVAAQVRNALALPEPLRRVRCTLLWQFIHTDRSRAFGPHGTGAFDRGNALEKYLDQAPHGDGQSLMAALSEAKFAETKTAALYHGTDADLAEGDVLEGGYGHPSSQHVWMTEDPDEAGRYGQHVYEVEASEATARPVPGRHTAPSATVVRRHTAASVAPHKSFYLPTGGGKYHRANPITGQAMCRGTILLDTTAMPFTVADDATRVHPMVCRKCLGSDHPAVKKQARMQPHRGHDVYGSNDINRLFPDGAPITSTPWPMAPRTKTQPIPYSKDLLGKALADPGKHMDEVDPRELHAYQPSITRAGVNYYLGEHYRQTGQTYADGHHVANQVPVVYTRSDGKSLLLSGHHRGAAALLKGEKLQCLHVREEQGDAKHAVRDAVAVPRRAAAEPVAHGEGGDGEAGPGGHQDRWYRRLAARLLAGGERGSGEPGGDQGPGGDADPVRQDGIAVAANKAHYDANGRSNIYLFRGHQPAEGEHSVFRGLHLGPVGEDVSLEPDAVLSRIRRASTDPDRVRDFGRHWTTNPQMAHQFAFDTTHGRLRSGRQNERTPNHGAIIELHTTEEPDTSLSQYGESELSRPPLRKHVTRAFLHVHHYIPGLEAPGRGEGWVPPKNHVPGSEMDQIMRKPKPIGYHRQDTSTHTVEIPLRDIQTGLHKQAATNPYTDYEDPKHTYVRFGDWPHDERSHNHVMGWKEDGVSVYHMDHHGDPIDPDEDLGRWHEHDEHCDKHCDLDSWNSDYGNDTREEMQGRVRRAETFHRGYGGHGPSDQGHLVQGEHVGFGHDGEPLLRNVKRVGDWINHRHHFVPTAEPHRQAEPDDADEPDEDFEAHKAQHRTAGLFGPPWFAAAHDDEIDAHHTPEAVRMGMTHHTSPQGHRYRLTADDRTVYAAYLGKGEQRLKKPQMVGTLHWFGGRATDDDTTVKGRISGIFVKPSHQRRGLASAMLDHARKQNPQDDIEHSTNLSEDAKGWSSVKASKAQSIEVAGVCIKAADTGRVLMLQRSFEDEDDPARGTWEFPGGHVDPDEDPFSAAVREWEEETGGKFPRSAPVVGNWISGGMYQGFVVMVEAEADLDINLDHEDRHVLNPDDPDGDGIEVVAWWDLGHLKSNPAVRKEVTKGTDWALLKKVTLPGVKKAATRGLGWHHVVQSQRGGDSYPHHSVVESYIQQRTGVHPKDLVWSAETFATADATPDPHGIRSPKRLESAERGYRTDPARVPPVIAIEHGGKREHVDGWHRLGGAERAGLSEVPAYVGRVRSTQTKTAVAEQEWYHGSNSPTPITHFERRDRQAVEGGPRDWNTNLGSHWTSDHQVAHDFTPSHGTLHHARLEMKNPKHYEYEHDLANEAHKWARSTGEFNENDPEPRGRRNYQGDEPYLDPKNENEGPLPGLDLRTHPRSAEIADRFKEHLRSQGHDGIVYGNIYEGEEGHPCAIPFDSHQIHVTSTHKPGECHQGLAQREWDDEAGDYKTAARTASTESWIRCQQGHTHWGTQGAAGLLLRHTDEQGQKRYLLQRRAPWVDHGSTWSTPGGALHPDESPEDGALREGKEEMGEFDSTHSHTLTDDHGGWAYHTVVHDVPERFHPTGDSGYEHAGHRWVTKAEMDGMDLHPGFAATKDTTVEAKVTAQAAQMPYHGFHEHATAGQGGRDGSGLGEPAGGHRGPSSAGLARGAGVTPAGAGGSGEAPGLTWHPQAAKDLKRLDRPVQRTVLDGLDGILNAHPTTMAQTHPLTGPMKGWYATKVSRGHRIIHRPSEDGGIHVGYVGLHEYEKAIQRLTSLAAAQPNLWPKHPLYRPGDKVQETTGNGNQYPATVHHQDESTDHEHHGTVWISQERLGREDSIVGVHPSRLEPHPDAPAEQHEHYRKQKALNDAGVPFVPEAERNIDESDRVTVHHLTDRPDFTPDIGHRPHNNTTMGGSLSPRLFVGDATSWAEGEHGYRRPYVAEMTAPRAVVRNEGGYLGEREIPARHFDKVHVTRVIPYGEHRREQDEPDYHSDVDTRTWSPKQHKDHLKAHREHLHTEHGWGWNEFDKNHNHVGLGDDDWDNEREEYIRRDRKGKPMTQHRSSKTSGKN